MSPTFHVKNPVRIYFCSRPLRGGDKMALRMKDVDDTPLIRICEHCIASFPSFNDLMIISMHCHSHRWSSHIAIPVDPVCARGWVPAPAPTLAAAMSFIFVNQPHLGGRRSTWGINTAPPTTTSIEMTMVKVMMSMMSVMPLKIMTCFHPRHPCLVCSRTPPVSRHCTAASLPHSSRTSIVIISYFRQRSLNPTVTIEDQGWPKQPLLQARGKGGMWGRLATKLLRESSGCRGIFYLDNDIVVSTCGRDWMEKPC